MELPPTVHQQGQLLLQQMEQARELECPNDMRIAQLNAIANNTEGGFSSAARDASVLEDPTAFNELNEYARTLGRRGNLLMSAVAGGFVGLKVRLGTLMLGQAIDFDPAGKMQETLNLQVGVGETALSALAGVGFSAFIYNKLQDRSAHYRPTVDCTISAARRIIRGVARERERNTEDSTAAVHDLQSPTRADEIPAWLAA